MDVFNFKKEKRFGRIVMFSIRKKMLIPLLLVGVIFCTACSGKAEFDGATDGSSQETADRMSSVMEGSVEVVENLPDRDIKVPEYLRGEKEEKLYKENSNDENSDQEKMMMTLFII